MSVPTSSQSDRRHPNLSRVPFEALVEIAAPQGTSFEAESIDLSATGMHLRTAYLPEVGTGLTFRFEGASDAPPILAGGQVVWAHDGPEGCEFGVRFADLEPKNAAAIRQIVGVSAPASATSGSTDAPKTLIGVGPIEGPTSTPRLSLRPGSPVRIHIEGVSAPMRATLRDDATKGAVVGSELKMLRLGAVVELEDKEHRTRRSARVDGVDCEIDDESKIPQLVVRLRYDAAATEGASMGPAKIEASGASAAPREATMPPPAMSKSESIAFDKTERIDHAAHAVSREAEEPSAESDPMSASSQQRISLPVAEESGKLDVVADGMKKVGSAMRDAMSGAGAMAARFGLRAKNTVSLLKGRAGKDRGEQEEVRRTTSPAPGNAGQKSRVLRPQGASRDFMNANHGEGSEEGMMQEIDTKKSARRKQIGIAMGVGLALVLAFFAFRKPKSAPVVAAPTPELAPAPAPAPLPAPLPVDPNAALAAAPLPAAAAPLAGEPTGVDSNGKPNPFGTTTVKKGTRMTLHLDGPITELRGIATTNGFVVAVPNRKSTEAANPLAAKDARIASAKVANVPGGAELTITFKDNVPSYVVRAKGDALEIVLSKDKAVAKKPAKKSSSKKSKKK